MDDFGTNLASRVNRLRGHDSHDLIFYALLIIFAVIAMFIFSDYGIGFDGPRQKIYGEKALDYYLSGFENRTSLTYINLYFYGGLFDMVAALACKVSPLGAYETRHLLNALVGILGILGTWKLARFLAGPRAALISASLLMLTPSYVGHMFMNPKDIPFAVGYVWSMYYILLAFKNLPRLRVSLILRVGFVLGLTLAVRIGGALLVAYTCLGAGLFALWPMLFTTQQSETLSFWKPLFRRGLAVGISLGSAFAVAYGVMLVFWPWAQQDPLHNPIRALELMSSFGDWSGIVLINGRYVEAMDLPWSYLLHYLAVKLPEALFLALLLGGIAIALNLAQTSPKRITSRQAIQLSFISFAIAFPVVYAIAKHSVLYDGMRHFIFIVPLICIIGGLGFHAFLAIVPNQWVRKVFTSLLILIMTAQAIAMAKLHPNQYVYYNIFAGWLSGADGKYEMDYWANSYKEAVETITAYAQERDGDAFETRTYQIYVDGPYPSATYYFPDNFTHTPTPDNADFYFTHTRWNLDKRLPGERIASVSRMGVDLTVIHQRPQPEIDKAE